MFENAAREPKAKLSRLSAVIENGAWDFEIDEKRSEPSIKNNIAKGQRASNGNVRGFDRKWRTRQDSNL